MANFDYKHKHKRMETIILQLRNNAIYFRKLKIVFNKITIVVDLLFFL